MKLFKTILLPALLISSLHATNDALEMIPLPLDTRQVEIKVVEIKVVEVPFVIGMSTPHASFQALNKPYVPPAVSFNEQEDINMVTVAGIKVTPNYRDDGTYPIELDYAGVDKDHQTEELLEAIIDCIYRIVAQEEGTKVEVKLSNLAKDSPLHAVFERSVKSHEAALKAK